MCGCHCFGSLAYKLDDQFAYELSFIHNYREKYDYENMTAFDNITKGLFLDHFRSGNRSTH